MNSRERVSAALNHQESDRVPIHDSLWASTVDRWRREGAPAKVSLAEYFDYDMVSFGGDVSPRFPVRTVSEDDECVIETTPYGGLRRNRKDYASVPEWLEFPCDSRTDWERIKERLTPSRDRIDWEGDQPIVGLSHDEREDSLQVGARAEWRVGLEGCKRARAVGKFVCYTAPIGFGHIHQAYVGTERLLIAVATEPEWVIDMYETNANLVIANYEMMVDGGFVFDGVFLACDLGYRSGTFFSPRHFEEQLHPTFERLFGYFGSKGLPVILHSDGRILEFVPYLVKEGLTCLNPLEVKAGMDVIALKREFGDRLAFMGGIDVRAMADPDPSVIEEEIKSKIPFAKRGGGYIYHSDHSVPNNVSFQRYCRVLELVKRYGVY